MKTLAPLAAAAVLALAVGPVLAASPRTFVSGKGSDSGTCAVSTPCRSFAFALTQTAASGEILVLDSAGYGAVTITQSVSIVAPAGIEGAVTAPSGGNGITIAAGTTDKVVLRGLTIDGAGAGANGVVFNSGGDLTITGCVVQNFVGADNQHGNGILIQHASGTPNIFISNTVVIDNSYIGVSFIPTGSGGGRIDVDRLTAFNNLIGFASYGGFTSVFLDGSLTNSVTNDNTEYGVQVIGRSGSGPLTRLTMSFDYAYGDKLYDFYSAGSSELIMSNCSSLTLKGEQSSSVYTFGNNSIANATSTAGVKTAPF